jgi:hypothetical protein
VVRGSGGVSLGRRRCRLSAVKAAVVDGEGFSALRVFRTMDRRRPLILVVVGLLDDGRTVRGCDGCLGCADAGSRRL